jgi:hypothetical protein
MILGFGLLNESHASIVQDDTASKSQRFAGISRPDPEGVPTEVAVGIVFLDVINIDDVDQTFTADFYLIYQWSDPRLDISKEASAPEVRIFELDEIWHPQLAILNQRNLKDYYKDGFRVDASGNVRYAQRFFGELSAPLDLKDFCFDEQTLSIQVASTVYSPQELELSYMEQLTGQRGVFSIAGWTVELETPRVTNEYLAFADRDLARIDFLLNGQRHAVYFILKLLVPLSLIVFMAWTVFWIDPSKAGPQIGLPTSAVFAFILYNFKIGSELPRISYLTRVDQFVLGATFLVFIALGEAVITTILSHKDKNLLARKIDFTFRYLYLILFAIIIAVAFMI